MQGSGTVLHRCLAQSQRQLQHFGVVASEAALKGLGSLTRSLRAAVDLFIASKHKGTGVVYTYVERHYVVPGRSYTAKHAPASTATTALLPVNHSSCTRSRADRVYSRDCRRVPDGMPHSVGVAAMKTHHKSRRAM